MHNNMKIHQLHDLGAGAATQGLEIELKHWQYSFTRRVTGHVVIAIDSNNPKASI